MHPPTQKLWKYPSRLQAEKKRKSQNKHRGQEKKEKSNKPTNLEEVLDTLGVVAVALTTDALHFLDLSSLAGSLNVLEMHILLLAEVHNGAQEVEQT